ncbi:MAG TPA: hypothetical protein VFO65_12165 [Acidimicrobiales bacterium]|nr:hypothetical protein [Acidimicrobiales bacterium]
MTTLQSATAVPPRPPADRVMRKVLRVGTAPRRSGRDLHRAFSRSILVSAARCLLTYLVLPFMAPAVGVAAGVGPWIGLPLGSVAIVSNVFTMRRFWAADHRWRWAFTAVSVSVIVLLLILMVEDVAGLMG